MKEDPFQHASDTTSERKVIDNFQTRERLKGGGPSASATDDFNPPISRPSTSLLRKRSHHRLGREREISENTAKPVAAQPASSITIEKQKRNMDSDPHNLHNVREHGEATEISTQTVLSQPGQNHVDLHPLKVLTFPQIPSPPAVSIPTGSTEERGHRRASSLHLEKRETTFHVPHTAYREEKDAHPDLKRRNLPEKPVSPPQQLRKAEERKDDPFTSHSKNCSTVRSATSYEEANGNQSHSKYHGDASSTEPLTLPLRQIKHLPTTISSKASDVDSGTGRSMRSCDVLSRGGRSSSHHRLNPAGHTQRTSSHHSFGGDGGERFSISSEADKKLLGFRQAERQGRPVCVCGASAFYERESVRFTNERLRLKEEAANLRAERAKMVEQREQLAHWTLEYEQRMNEIETASHRLQRQSEAVHNEDQRVRKIADETNQLRSQLEEEKYNLEQREHEIEKKMKKVEKDMTSAEEVTKVNNEQNQRIVQNWISIKRAQSQVKMDQESTAKKQETLERLKCHLMDQQSQLKMRQEELEGKWRSLNEEVQKLDEQKTELNELDEKTKLCLQKAENVQLINRKVEATLEKKKLDLESQRRILSEEREALEAEKSDLLVQKEKQTAAVLSFQEERKQIEVESMKRREEEEEKFRKKMESERLTFVKEMENEKEQFQIFVDRAKGDLSDERHELDCEYERLEKRNFLLEQQQVCLDTKTSELEEKERNMNALLEEKEEELNQRERTVRVGENVLNERKNDLQTLEAHLKAEEDRITALSSEFDETVREFDRQRNRMENEQANWKNEKREVEELQKRLEEKEVSLNKREEILTTKEGQAVWMKDIYRDVNDLKERYQLQLGEMDWEKQTLEQVRKDFESKENRHYERFRQKEDQLKAKEKDLSTREKEIRRLEKLVGGRVEAFQSSQTAGAAGSSHPTSGRLHQRLLTVRPATTPAVVPQLSVPSSPQTTSQSPAGIKPPRSIAASLPSLPTPHSLLPERRRMGPNRRPSASRLTLPAVKSVEDTPNSSVGSSRLPIKNTNRILGPLPSARTNEEGSGDIESILSNDGYDNDNLVSTLAPIIPKDILKENLESLAEGENWRPLNLSQDSSLLCSTPSPRGDMLFTAVLPSSPMSSAA